MNSPCLWSEAGKQAEIKLNGNECVLVGTNALKSGMREVWASFIRAGEDYFCCDAINRAHIALQIVVDRREDPNHGDVLIREMDNLNDMGLWHAALPAGSHAVKMSFVYNVLLAEANGNTG
jgi:hypothetical protein